MGMNERIAKAVGQKMEEVQKKISEETNKKIIAALDGFEVKVDAYLEKKINDKLVEEIESRLRRANNDASY